MSAAATDATWNLNGTGNFNTTANWTPGTVPDGTAFFDISNQNAVSFSANSVFGSWTFNSGASNYTFANSFVQQFTGAGIVINGGGANFTNNDTLQFANTSTAGSANITNNDTLQFANTSTAGSATITNNNFLEFNNASTAGSATITNNGILEFNNASSAGSAAITNNTLLLFFDTSSAGGATIINNGFLEFDNTSTAGNAAITNNSSLEFRGTSTAGGATIINNCCMVFTDSSTAGSATIFNNNNLTFFGTSTAGNARLVNAAGGDVDFSFSTGPLGDNRLSAGSIAGAGNFNLGGNELTVGGNNLSTAVSGGIAGAGGALVKIGTSTLTLSGNNTYSGATTVNSGGLFVNSSLLSSSMVTVNGGFVGGTGTLPNTFIGAGGTLAPGNSIGTINVNGNLTFGAGGVYAVEVSPTAADRTNVTGTATLTGASVQAIGVPGSFRSQTFTILNAGTLVGTFSGLTQVGGIPGTRNPHLTYDANNVFLVLDPGSIQLAPGTPGNQSKVAGGINNAAGGGSTPPMGFDALLNLSGPALINALGQVSGQTPTGGVLGALQMMNGFLSLTLNPFVCEPNRHPGNLGCARALGGANVLSREAADAYAAVMPVKAPLAIYDKRWSVWGQGYGGTNKTDGNAAAGSTDTTSRAWGFAAGADYRATANTTLGFALAGGEMNWGLARGLGSGRSDVFQVGAYGSHRAGAAYVSAALAYAWHDMSTDRTVTIAGTDVLRASFNAHNIGARLEAGYRIATYPLGVTPYGAVQVQNVYTPSYGETAFSGAGTFALAYGSRNATATRVELGSWFDRLETFAHGHAVVLRGRAAYAHNGGYAGGGLGAVFQTLPGSTYTVNGAAPARDLALLSAGAELRLARGVLLGARFDGEFSGRARTYAGSGTARYEW
ncbi:MAG: autotransporter domain-containing protein [Proteobacteria bacterium]|nr:autotransporter domain-containing protein [Pseudomonadota bacterium]